MLFIDWLFCCYVYGRHFSCGVGINTALTEDSSFRRLTTYESRALFRVFEPHGSKLQ